MDRLKKTLLEAEARWLTPPEPPRPRTLDPRDASRLAEWVIEYLADDLGEYGYTPDETERETALEIERILEEALDQIKPYAHPRGKQED